MAFDPLLIPHAVRRYHRERDRYVKLADRIAEICRDDICEQNAIRAQVTFRVKTEKSLEGKLKRFSLSERKTYQTVDEIFEDISDLAGVRIAAYRVEDCDKIVDHLCREFKDAKGKVDVDRKDLKRPENENYYRAIHVQIGLPEAQQIGTYDNVSDISCEIQVCTMISHVWNEIEHDIGYKPDLGAPSDDERYNLAQLGRTVRQGDLIVSSLLAANDRRISNRLAEIKPEADKSPFIDVHDFVSRMRGFNGGVMTKFAENSGQLFELLADLDLASPHALDQALAGFDAAKIEQKIEDFNTHLINSGIEGLQVDQHSSDLLLIALMERRLPEITEVLKGRAGRGRGRPSRLHRIAIRYQNHKPK
ncbi:GTP pyrophosphokinase [Cereibacter changlensis]|uniref:GTP pyrophosphokinase n=1 Tax=Cereibacter changlensis TaxID=402884 RepID=UPI004034D30D